MLRYALIFLVIALLASAFGMFGLSGVAMEAARILFFVFLVMLIISFLGGRRGQKVHLASIGTEVHNGHMRPWDRDLQKRRNGSFRCRVG